MKTFILLFSVLLFAGLNVRADHFIFKGDTMRVNMESPLEKFPGIDTLREHLKGFATEGCYDCYMAPYDAEWTIIDNNLYLTNIYSANLIGPHRKVDMRKLFPKEGGRIKANWVTQEIWLPIGQPVRWVNIATPAYKGELQLFIINGQINTVHKHNYATKRTLIDSIRNPKTANPICKLIDWSKIPDMKDQQIRVMVNFTTGMSDKPENVWVVRPVEESIYTQEAKRLVEKLPWPASYYHGEVLRESIVIPVIFSEEARKNCSR